MRVAQRDDVIDIAVLSEQATPHGFDYSPPLLEDLPTTQYSSLYVPTMYSARRLLCAGHASTVPGPCAGDIHR